MSFLITFLPLNFHRSEGTHYSLRATANGVFVHDKCKHTAVQVCLDKLLRLLQLFLAHKHGKSVLLSNMKYKSITMQQHVTVKVLGKISFNATISLIKYICLYMQKRKGGAVKM